MTTNVYIIELTDEEKSTLELFCKYKDIPSLDIYFKWLKNVGLQAARIELINPDYAREFAAQAQVADYLGQYEVPVPESVIDGVEG